MTRAKRRKARRPRALQGPMYAYTLDSLDGARLCVSYGNTWRSVHITAQEALRLSDWLVKAAAWLEEREKR